MAILYMMFRNKVTKPCPNYQRVSLCYSTKYSWKYIDIPFYYRKHYETQTTIEVTPNRI